MEEEYQKIINLLGEDRVERNVPLANYTTFRIGGPADLFYTAETEEELVRVLGVVREARVPYLILGGGSNLLVGDRGFRGIVIKFLISNFEQQQKTSSAYFEQQQKTSSAYFKFLIKGETVLVTVGAGMPMSVLLNELVKNSITGLEFMAGIPGTVGGAVRGNAGAWQQNFSDKVSRVKIVSESGETIWLSKDDCQFVYRGSRFKNKPEESILSVELALASGNAEASKKLIADILEKRSVYPTEPSVGSVFVNPKPQAAGEMIEACGLKGKQIGGAKISEAHANFIVNIGGAKATEVAALIDLIKKKVKEKFGVDLKEEIVRIGEF